MTALEKEQALLRQWRALPTEEQQEALNFVELLRQKSAAKRPLRSGLGLCADLNVKITPEDIAQARKEIWSNFPRSTDPTFRHSDDLVTAGKEEETNSP